jgi:hypothetical protein
MAGAMTLDATWLFAIAEASGRLGPRQGEPRRESPSRGVPRCWVDRDEQRDRRPRAGSCKRERSRKYASGAVVAAALVPSLMSWQTMKEDLRRETHRTAVGGGTS